ncbi:hypothetical protein KDA82_01815 [Streptomyces daliensis]|uniref:Uncharacterized protein n=1 Tax=Streptomyces daliensis TaxID=299421 RepID=A0A8T4IQY8_9ACTN|nr:hypothetical protein [Streptomyces daliensis]
MAPACAGGHEWCSTPDRHPRNTRWPSEATTEPEHLDALWDRRSSYGVIGATGRGMTAYYVEGLGWSRFLAACVWFDIHAPLVRLAAQEGLGPSRLYTMACGDAEEPVDARLRVHPPGLPLVLPPANTGAHAKWLAAPIAETPLPTLAELTAVLRSIKAD